MAYAMAKSVNLSFNRIQFTPDVLLLILIYMYNQKTNEFEYKVVML